MKQSKMLRTITEKAGLEAETLPGVPLLELSGDDSILVENHICVVGYTENEILIRVSFGLIQIVGHDLVVSRIDCERLAVRGSFRSITLIK